MARILVIDDNARFRKTLCMALTGKGHDARPAPNGEDALGLAEKEHFDAAFIDMKMPGMSGLDFLDALKDVQPSVAGIILTGFGSIPDAVDSMKLGGFHYLTKPVSMQEIEKVLKQVVSRNGFCAICDNDSSEYHGIVGQNKTIKAVVEVIKNVKDSQLPVLIFGESGTGKELIARALHYDSVRKNSPFIPINCASLKYNLLENELFGHVKGAFTGAIASKEGIIKSADGGTLFIDEIADMDSVVQASLLRFLENGMVRPLGASQEIKVSTRIVAAINRNIEEEVRSGRFRMDLYYRLNVCRINVPPLRSRLDDIPLLVSHFVSIISKNIGAPFSLSPGALERLGEHTWPGNVRELFHTLQRAALLNRGKIITENLIEQSLEFTASPDDNFNREKETTETLKDGEISHIMTCLENNKWNISKTALELKINRRTLQRKMARYNIRRSEPV